MNWYEHHIKDYAAAIQYHNWDEDMAYTRMIRLYYRKEEPLPGTPEEVCEKIGARTPEQQQAVHTILRDFFTLEADGRYHQEKCDEVLAEYLAGKPEREQKKVNEQTRVERHREERRELFAALNAAGQHLPYNCPMAQLREAVKRLAVTGGVSGGVTGAPQGVSGGVTGGGGAIPGFPSENDAAGEPVTQPATAPVTPATATQPPLPTTHYPLPNSSVSHPSGALAATPAAAGAGLPGIPPAPPPEPTAKPAKPRKPRAPKPPDEEGPSVAVWRAYASTFLEVHQVEPVRNARVNAQLAQLVERLGKDDAVQVAAFYVRDPFYRARHHPVDILLKDAEGLRARWAKSNRGLPDPAQLGPRLDGRTQHRVDRMAEALGSYADMLGADPPPAARGARQPYDLEADHGPQGHLPAPRRD